MFEHHRQPLLTRSAFTRRMVRCGLLAAALAGVVLGVGAWGYHSIAGLEWVDGFHNASMILSGEGPVDPMRTTGAKVFASVYSLFSGVVFLTSVAVLLAPLAHRILHRLHLEGEEEPAGG